MRQLAIAGAIAVLTVPAAIAIAADTGPSPAQDCRAQRTAIGAAAFNSLYGTNRTRSNAMGKCVSKVTHSQAVNHSNASKACRAEQSDPDFAANHGGMTFDQFYGSGKKGANAFGKCVSSKAKAANQADQHATVNAARTCKAQRKSDPAGFAAKWGTKRNAYGKCVSATAKANHT
jgi:hypothetical protein